MCTFLSMIDRLSFFGRELLQSSARVALCSCQSCRGWSSQTDSLGAICDAVFSLFLSLSLLAQIDRPTSNKPYSGPLARFPARPRPPVGREIERNFHSSHFRAARFPARVTWTCTKCPKCASGEKVAVVAGEKKLEMSLLLCGVCVPRDIDEHRRGETSV